MEFQFLKRPDGNKPSSAKPGCFYWIGTQIWFSLDTDPEHMVLLSNEVSAELIERIENIEDVIFGSEVSYVTDDILDDKLEELRNDILSRFDEIIGSDFGDFITREEVEQMIDNIRPVVDLGDSDYEEIAKRLNNLTWEII